jgi:hypothetical protein
VKEGRAYSSQQSYLIILQYPLVCGRENVPAAKKKKGGNCGDGDMAL